MRTSTKSCLPNSSLLKSLVSGLEIINAASELAGELDILFVSHHHGDHGNVPTIRTLAAGGKTTFELPRPCLKEVAQVHIVVPEARLIVPEPGHSFAINGVQVEPIHAIHGNQQFTVLTREPDFIDSIRFNCGNVLTMLGKRILHPGDSLLTEEHLGLKNIDVLFVSPTVHNMCVDRSMILINTLQPAYIFPQHFARTRKRTRMRSGLAGILTNCKRVSRASCRSDTTSSAWERCSGSRATSFTQKSSATRSLDTARKTTVRPDDHCGRRRGEPTLSESRALQWSDHVERRECRITQYQYFVLAVHSEFG